MTPVDYVSNMLFYRCEDGRIIFRPWGAKGPVFLLTERQRRIRAWVQLVFHAGCIVTIFALEDIFTLPIACAFAGAFMAVSYLLHWLYGLGLPRTTVPPRPTPEYTRGLMLKVLPRWLIGTILGLLGAVALFLLFGLAFMGPTLSLLGAIAGDAAFIAAFVWIWRLTAAPEPPSDP